MSTLNSTIGQGTGSGLKPIYNIHVTTDSSGAFWLVGIATKQCSRHESVCMCITQCRLKRMISYKARTVDVILWKDTTNKTRKFIPYRLEN